MATTKLDQGPETAVSPWTRQVRSLWQSRHRETSWRVLADSLGHLNDDDGFAMASHVALSALMAIFPFLIFVTALAGFIGEAQLAGTLADLLFATWPKIVAAPIAAEVHRVVAGANGGLLTVSALIAIYLASNGVAAIRMALNRAYRVVEHRSFLKLQMQNFVFVVIGALTGLTLAVLGLLGPLIFAELTRWLPRLAEFQGTFSLLRFGVTGGLVVIVLVSAHVWLPARRPAVHKLWPGVAITLALWLIAAGIFAAYLERFANYVATYAGLASAVTAIFFLYLVALAMIFGAEFNATLKRLRDGKLA
jgi:membrane protein